MTGERDAEASFAQHVQLLQGFLAHRDDILESIQTLLNAQRMPAQYLQDGAVLSRQFEDCFLKPGARSSSQQRLRGQLQHSHWADGFKPRDMPGMHNDLIDPAQLMIRGFYFWQQTRWPGRNGRMRYAHTLFSAYLIRSLELLVMRLWDAGADSAGERLAQVQDVLDRLWRSTPADQPVLVRDARWLIPLAQSPTTDELAPYFPVAKRVAEDLPEEAALEIHKASVQMAGGHLRSQLRHYCMNQDVSLGDPGLTLSSRNSNALDFALTIQHLVPLLARYERAIDTGGDRLPWAGAICQALSSDPELFVNRPDLLGAYSMIEHLFITSESGHAGYTSMGERHLQLVQEYAARIGRLSQALVEDLPHFRPAAGAYSPYGLIYGFSSNLTEHMALKSLQPDTAARFSVEDAFTEGDAASGKLAWVSGWRKLPHIKDEVQRLFDYPQPFAAAMFERLEQALRRGESAGGAAPIVHTGRVFIAAAEESARTAALPSVADLPAAYFHSSDPQVVAAHQAQPCATASVLRDRQEGMFLVSYQTAGGWTAITKDLLTEVVGAGRDVQVAGLPGNVAEVLSLMCGPLTLLAENKRPS